MSLLVISQKIQCSSFICSAFSLPRLFCLILQRNHFQFHQLSECSVKALFLPFERSQGTTSLGRMCFSAQPDPGGLSNSHQDVPGTQVTNGCSPSSGGNVSASEAMLSSCSRHSAVKFSLNNHHRHNYGWLNLGFLKFPLLVKLRIDVNGGWLYFLHAKDKRLSHMIDSSVIFWKNFVTLNKCSYCKS